MKPVYTAENTKPAYQLNWSVSLFGRDAIPPSTDWLDQLGTAVNTDGVRILEFRSTKPNAGQFLVSTQPELSPSQIIRSLKGRWQYLIREINPTAFRRNYFISSIGEANCRVLDRYIAKQTTKHLMADPTVQQRIELLQFYDKSIDLSQTLNSNYGQFVYSLQVVIENAGGWHDIRESVLSDYRSMIIRAANQKHWRLSRIGILSNHIHILLGAGVTQSPAEVALSMMNNLAYVQGLKPVFRYSYYVGTFGSYNRNVIRRSLADGG